VRRIAAAVEAGENGQSSVVFDGKCDAREFLSAPVLRSVPDVQDFDNLFGGTVHNDIRRADQLAGSPHLARPAKAGKGCQLFYAVDNRLSDIAGGGGIVFEDAIDCGFKLIGRFGRPTNLPHE
jgi:hypothetical protein